jgi:hypothetical protein
MSTTVPTSHATHTAFEKTALALAIVALVFAVAGLVGTVAHLFTTGTTSGTASAAGVVATAPALLTDSSVKVRGGAVLPLETVTDADLPAYVTPMSAEFQDQVTGHLQRGPVS